MQLGAQQSYYYKPQVNYFSLPSLEAYITEPCQWFPKPGPVHTYVRAVRKQSVSIYKVLAQVVPLEMITYSNECINLTVRTTVWTMLERKIHPHPLTKWFWKQSEMGLFLWCQLGVWIFVWRLLIKTTICIWFRWYYNETGMLSVYLVRAPGKGHGSRWCVCWQAGCCVHLCVLVTR